MREDELRAIFDRQAAGYDEQWEKMAPIRDGLFLLVESVFAELRGTEPGKHHVS
jgi:tRNA (cmo5U34)-methyltransferase